MKGQEPIGRRPEYPTYTDNFVEYGHEDEDLGLAFEASGVECYFVRVNSPSPGGIYRDTSNYDNRANRSFLARAYKRAHHRQNHVVIMYNGLDETVFNTSSSEQLFAFYDELGVRLAAAGMLAILLPTPYHMNRALAYTSVAHAERLREQHRDRFIAVHTPSEALTAHPASIYANHFQGCKETFELCRFFLTGRERRVLPRLDYQGIFPERVAATIHDWVGRDPAISLLGYSLGGLRALTEFLVDRVRAKRRSTRPLFSGCVAVCSGGSLSDLPAPFWSDPAKWKTMIDSLVIEESDAILDEALARFKGEQGRFAHEYFQTLRDIFLGNAQSIRLLGPTAARTCKSMLFLLGGADTLVPPDAIRRINPEGGVNILQVAGLGHLFPFDLAWNTTKTLICDVVTRFLDNVPVLARLPDPEELIQQLVLLDICFTLMPYRRRVSSKTLRDAGRLFQKEPRPRGLVVRAMGRQIAERICSELDVERPDRLDEPFRKFVAESLDDLALQVQRKLVNPALIWPEWEKRFLDGVLARDGGLQQDVRKLVDLLKPNAKLDEMMVQQDLLTDLRRKELLELQESKLATIRERLAASFIGFARHALAGNDAKGRTRATARREVRG